MEMRDYAALHLDPSKVKEHRCVIAVLHFTATESFVCISVGHFFLSFKC